MKTIFWILPELILAAVLCLYWRASVGRWPWRFR